MKTWKLTFEDGTVEYIIMDNKGIRNIWIYDPYIIEITEVQSNDK